MQKHFIIILVGLALALFGCADELVPEDGGSDAEPFTHMGVGAGITVTTVNASDYDVWMYLDLETQTQVFPDPAETSTEWDIAFQRFNIKINGGVSGSGGMEVATLREDSFGGVTRAPDDGYATDQADGDDEDEEPDFAISGAADEGRWYTYSGEPDHLLTSRQWVYVLRTVEGNYFKIEVVNYYDDVGTSGVVQLRWAPVLSPDTPGIDVDAPFRADWVYLRISDGAVVTVADPSTSLEWDLAFQGMRIATNSGTSGAGMGGAQLVAEGTAYEDVTTAPAMGYAVDEMLPEPGPPGTEGEFSGNPALNMWWAYDLRTHTISPVESRVFIMRGANGDFGKALVQAFQGDRYSLLLDPL